VDAASGRVLFEDRRGHQRVSGKHAQVDGLADRSRKAAARTTELARPGGGQRQGIESGRLASMVGRT
jgi:hypothetical protein